MQDGNLFPDLNVEEVKEEKIPSHPNQIKTANGYDLYECISAMQKEIRRCNETQALYWAFEAGSVNLTTSDKAMKSEDAWDYVWHRLLVTASEEIGILDPQAVILTQSLSQAHRMRRDQQIIAMAVLYLARSPKNREVNDFVAYVHNKRKEGWKLPMPDYAIDVHTYRGKSMGRGGDYWWKEGRRINNAKGVNKYFKWIYESLGRKANPDWVDKEMKIIEEANKEAGYDWAK